MVKSLSNRGVSGVALCALLLTAALAPVTAPLAAQVAKSADADRFGTAEEAKALLDLAVSSLKADQNKTLAEINAGAARFRNRDLYPFCADRATGVFTAHPTLVGQNLREQKDSLGKSFGDTILRKANADRFEKVQYYWAPPGRSEPKLKQAFVKAVGDQVCAVGFHP